MTSSHTLACSASAARKAQNKMFYLRVQFTTREYAPNIPAATVECEITTWKSLTCGFLEYIIINIDTQIVPLFSLGSWRIKGTDESALGKDLSVPLMFHDPSDLGSLIQIRIIPKERTLTH